MGKLDLLQKQVKKDQKQRLDDFDTKRSHKMMEKKLIKVTKMCKNENERQALLAN